MDIRLFSGDIKFKYRVSAVIINNDKLLVNKYDEKRFCLPGGYAEVGESSLEAIKREVKEEVQLEIKDAKYIGLIENFFTNFRGDKTHGLDFYYIIKISNTEAEKIDMNYVENDKDGIVEHHFSWINISELNLYELVPDTLIKVIQKKEENFHYIIKE